MSDEINLEEARRVYEILAESLDEHGIKYYDRHDEDLTITTALTGDDIPVNLIIGVDAELNIFKIVSFLPITVNPENQEIFAKAVNELNRTLVRGNFDYNLDEGELSYRNCSSYANSLVSTGFFWGLIVSCFKVVDEVNDRFLAMNQGLMSLDEFIAAWKE